jgi:hypothetical protein
MFGTREYSYAVWEKDAVHQVITLDDSGPAAIQTFIYTESSSAVTLIINGNGPLLGSYIRDSGAPAPLALANPFTNGGITGSWIAQDPTNPTSWRWNMQYVPEGLVTTTHLSMNHTFANVYIIRGDATGGLHYIYGQMRYGGGILADYKVTGAAEITVIERDGGPTTVYTPTSTRVV